MGKNSSVQIRGKSGRFLPLITRVSGLIILMTSTAVAQLTSTVELGYTHDSNVFGNFAQVPDNYLQLSLGLDDYLGWDCSSLEMSYYGVVSSYDSYPEQDNWNHSVNLNYSLQLSRNADEMDSSEAGAVTEKAFALPVDSTETKLALSGTANRTVPHSGDFAAYINYNAAAVGDMRYTFARTVIGHLRYEMNYTGYDQLPSLSNLENVGSLSVGVMPVSGVYFHVGGSYGNKRYCSVDTVSSAVTSLILMHSKGHYKGKGKGSSQGSSSMKTYLLDSPSATQATYGFGLNVFSGPWKGEGRFLVRKDLSGSARYISAVAKLATLQSEVYDDPYSYQGNEISLAVAGDSLIAGIDFSIGLNSANKKYNRAAFDTSQTVVVAAQRQDNLTGISFGISRRFSTAGFPSGYRLKLTYDHVGNSSNDQYYEFTDDILTIAMSVDLF